MNGLWLAYLQLTFDYYNGQGQVHAYFDIEYLGNDDRYGKITTDMKYQVMFVP